MNTQTTSTENRLSILLQLTGAVLGRLDVDCDALPDDARPIPAAVELLRPFALDDRGRVAMLDNAIAFDGAVLDYLEAKLEDQAAAFLRVLDAAKPFSQPRALQS